MDKKLQVIEQCKATVHMATEIARLHSDYIDLLKEGDALDPLVDIVGKRTAYLMDVLGEVLNGMDAVDDEADGWMGSIFEEAHVLWPQPPTKS